MAKEKQGRVSPARALVSLVWDQSQQQGKSWVRFNGVMCSTVKLAIKGAMEFALDDFQHFWKEMRGGYWFHGDSGAKGEGFYCLAVEMDNLSACLSYEAWAKRKPFLLDTGARVSVGSDVDWEGERTKLTSFDDDSESITLISYKHDHQKEKECPKCKRSDHGGTSKILHRYTVTHTSWLAEMKRRKAMRTPPAVGTTVQDKNGKLWVVTASTCRDAGQLDLETLARDGDSIRNPYDRIDGMRYPTFLREGWEVKTPAPKLSNGTELSLKGEAWKVSYVTRDRVDVETVKLRENSEWAEKSHSALSLPAFVAMGFEVVPKAKKRA